MVNRRFHRKEDNATRFGRYKKNHKQQLESYILNLSSKTLSLPQLSVLRKGLGFVPNTDKPLDFTEGIQRLTRTLRLKHRFRDQEQDGQDSEKPKPPPFKPKSNWAPPSADPATELYLSSLPDKLAAIQKRPYLQNLSKAEWRALSTLRKDQSLVIKKADKGSCLVVEDTSQYIADGLSHLADTDIYQPITADPTVKLTEAINEFVTVIEKKGHIDRNMRDFLLNNAEKVRTQQLYFLKKVHKGPHIVRPIVSGSSGPTENLSALLDYFLQPLLPGIPSYIKDSKHVTMLLEKHSFPADCILTTIDVKSLYLNIPHNEGIRSTLHHLYHLNPNHDDVPFPETTAEAMLRTVLEHNYFEFNGAMYQQIQGTAMGTKMAPAYANIFMDELEQKIISNLPTKPLMWKRYIDDIIAVWSDPIDNVKKVLEGLNLVHDTIKFTSEVSSEKIIFLDLEIYKGRRFHKTGHFDIQPHFKETNRFQYLHFNSSHPRATFKGVVRGELTRILRASSDQHTFDNNKKFLLSQFRARGYPKSLTDHVAQGITFQNRQATLLDKPPPQLDRPPFITLYSSQVTPKQIADTLKPPPGLQQPVLCFRKDKSIASQLVRARLKGAKPPLDLNRMAIKTKPYFGSHSRPCSTPGCLCCQLMSGKERIQSSKGTHITPTNTSCNSTGLVYLLECKLCSTRNRYVGQTSRSLKERLAGHRAAYRAGKNMPLYTHFRRRTHTLNSITVTVLQVLHDPTQDNLLAAEAAWMEALNTKLPNGLNSKF